MMNHDEAMRILNALVEGHDPISNQPLPRDSVLQNATVMRALLLAHVSVRADVDRHKRRSALPPRVGTTWSDEEDQKLVTAWKGQQSPEDIASNHGRTVRAIESRLVRLGLITADSQKSFPLSKPVLSAGGESTERRTRRRRGSPPAGSSTITASPTPDGLDADVMLTSGVIQLC